MQVQIERTFRAPQSLVFKTLTDFGGLADRISAITKVEVMTEGPTRIGTRFKETRVFGGKESSETMEVTALEQDRLMVLEASSCGSHYKCSHEIEARGADQTHVKLTFVGRPIAWYAWLLLPIGLLFKGMMKKCIEKDFDDLEKEFAKAATQ